MIQEEDYLYDAFISYPHQYEHHVWVHDIFRNILDLYLTQELGEHPRIFLDARGGIKSGDAWPQRLKYALAHTKLLIPIWSVNYFLSDWCMAECYVILHREMKLGYRTSANPAGLIHPIKLFDGRRYPPFASKIAPLDCTDYNHISESYKTSPQYTRLQEAIERWAPELATSIEAAPSWRPEWREKEWLDDPVAVWIVDPDFRVPSRPFRAPSMAGPNT